MRRDEEESRETTEQGLLEGRAVSRREFLKYAGVAGAVVTVGGGLSGFLAACGGTTTATTAAGTGTTATTAGGTGTTVTTAGGTGSTLAAGKTKIVIGAARPISGALAFFEANAFGPIYKMWVDEVNAAGGINVGGTKLQVEMKVYDDQSDLDTSMRLLTKLMEQDKVDFVFSPTSTAFLFAAAGVANAHKYILMSAEGGATSLEPKMKDLPYYFQFLNYADHNQVPVQGQVLKEVGAKTVGIIYIDDLHGIEYSGVAAKRLPENGIQIAFSEAIPADIKDVSALLKKAETANVDGLLIYAYPDQNFLAVGQMMQLKYNPKFLLLGPGGNYQFFPGNFGNQVVQGVCADGAWNEKSSPAAKDFAERFIARNKIDNMDWWGAQCYWAELQFFQAAIEKAGTLDQTAIRDIMATGHFPTMLGDTFMTNQILDVSCYLGQMGQWQNGIFEVIDPGAKRTAPPIYPKPAWPAAPTSTT